MLPILIMRFGLTVLLVSACVLVHLSLIVSGAPIPQYDPQSDNPRYGTSNPNSYASLNPNGSGPGNGPSGDSNSGSNDPNRKTWGDRVISAYRFVAPILKPVLRAALRAALENSLGPTAALR